MLEYINLALIIILLGIVITNFVISSKERQKVYDKLDTMEEDMQKQKEYVYRLNNMIDVAKSLNLFQDYEDILPSL